MKPDWTHAPVLYRGSVKEVCGPFDWTKASGSPPRRAVAFKFSDAFSVFDWGKMPDALAGKGEALAQVGATFFRALESPRHWRAFSKSSVALELRRGAGAMPGVALALNEMGERLQASGLRTHFLEKPAAALATLIVEEVHVERPRMTTVLGQVVADYSAMAPAPKSARLIPLEVVFRFACPPGSSLWERVRTSPESLMKSGAGHAWVQKLLASMASETPLQWDAPMVECFTKLEPTDRPLPLTEALAISTIGGDKFQELMLKNMWTAGFLKWALALAGYELMDGKLEWALREGEAGGELMLVDAIGPDELRLVSNAGEQHSKEVLRAFYRETEWFRSVSEAKQKAKDQGEKDWKRLVTLAPPRLPATLLEEVALRYRNVAEAVRVAMESVA